MKCPHCTVAIHEEFAMGAPFELSGFYRDGQMVVSPVKWQWHHMRCPECFEPILFLERFVNPIGFRAEEFTRAERFMAFPRGASRPIAKEVTDPYRSDFAEAARILPDSEKASAAMSRRLLQSILRDKAEVKHGDLYDEIDEVTKSGKLPPDLADALHLVRVIGNFAAHPMKSKNTGMIVDVEPGEAGWTLDVLERLLDFYFVGPAIMASRKAALNKKLAEVGKQPLP